MFYFELCAISFHQELMEEEEDEEELKEVHQFENWTAFETYNTE